MTRAAQRAGSILALATTGSWPALAMAHSFGQVYTLPVPVWMYLYGASAALVLSFVIVAYFAKAPAAASRATGKITAADTDALVPQVGPRTLGALQALSLLGLLLCIATGLWGTRNAYANFNMTFFWVVFMLGFAYLTALFGNLYERINPWRVICALIERAWPRAFAGCVAYPAVWGYTPALLFYIAFIWIELFARSGPHDLALLLLGYTALTVLGAWWFGSTAWFQHAEFLAVFLRLTGKMSVLVWRCDAAGRRRVRWRWPFAGLLQDRAEHLSLLLFILFMLSSTSFDGLRETAPWVKLYWQDLHGVLKPWVGDNIVDSYPILRPLYLAWQTLWLIASPLVYLGIYWAFMALMRWLVRSDLTVRDLALRFAYSLLPIALVYNITHYYTLLVGQGTQILRLISDPFGWGWNLFGTTHWLLQPIILKADQVWNTQVALILLGHVAGVVIAHFEALRIFPERRRATLSQLPMLLLMVAFTTLGLWILSLPISPGQGPR